MERTFNVDVVAYFHCEAPVKTAREKIDGATHATARHADRKIVADRV